MTFTKEEYKKFSKRDYDDFILGGDIGGTNTNLGIFGIKNDFPTLLLSFHFKSKRLKDLYSAINETMKYTLQNYKIKITECCLGIAGALSYKRDYVRVTNANLDFSKKVSLKKTDLKDILLMNDFEAVGYGINMLNRKDVYTIKKAKKIEKAPIVVIGAGTGLGKTTLIYNENYNMYIPLPSEVHHSDFAVQSKFELDLADFIKKYRKIRQNISNGDILSGDGLANIYFFLRMSKKYKETPYTGEIDKSYSKPELISKYRKIDITCKETFEIFKKIYARVAKNLALDAMSLGGVYIAGGIAPKNKDIFDKEFVRIFEDNQRMVNILKEIPIYLILNYNVGLLGAGFAGAKFFNNTWDKNDGR